MKLSGLVLITAIAAWAPAHADVLLLEAINSAPANDSSGLPRPSTGVSMDRVQAQFGQPDSIKAAVGEPPITRWVYPAYTVYFEHQHVIDVVVHR